MFEHLGDNYFVEFELKSRVAEDFLDKYRQAKAGDIYRWLWEGEFGAGNTIKALTLDRLTSDIRLARMHPSANVQKIWEDLGLAFTRLKINLVPYSDSGCPLKRLLMLAERGKEMRSDTLRFKQDWSFMKTQIVPGMAISVDEMTGFENSIPFHVTPEVPFSKDFDRFYGTGYEIVPRNLFFQYFPEYEP